MKITHFQRLSLYPSISRVFATIRSALTGAEVTVRVCPYESRGIFKRLCNIIDAACRQADVYHVTGDVHYLTLLLRKNRTVLTICDCGGMLRESGIRKLIFQLVWLKAPVWRSAVVCVISEHTKQEVLRFTSCPENKIRVIPVPVGREFEAMPKPFPTERPTILQIGTSENKNVERLVSAITGLPCKLILVGRASTEVQRQLAQVKVEYEWVANISDAEIVERYQNADLVTFCSTYEGFGMPIVEANAVGRPVVTSNIEPMAWVAGGSACLVNPYDPLAIRDGILRVISDRGYREELIQRGFENVKRFRAEAVARAYMDVYQELVGPQPNGVG